MRPEVISTAAAAVARMARRITHASRHAEENGWDWHSRSCGGNIPPPSWCRARLARWPNLAARLVYPVPVGGQRRDLVKYRSNGTRHTCRSGMRPHGMHLSSFICCPPPAFREWYSRQGCGGIVSRSQGRSPRRPAPDCPPAQTHRRLRDTRRRPSENVHRYVGLHLGPRAHDWRHPL